LTKSLLLVLEPTVVSVLPAGSSMEDGTSISLAYLYLS
jgi:hypothetical protein